MKVAVLGGGNGGHAMAADLSMKGHEVRFFELPEFEENIEVAKLRGGIEVLGILAQPQEKIFVNISKITSNIEEAIRGAKLIMVTVPAFAHETFIKRFANFLENGQVIVFNAGRLATLTCIKILKDMHIKKDVLIGETATLNFVCRLKGPSRVNVISLKKKVRFSACPSNKNKEALTILNELYPEFYAGEHVFDLFTSAPKIHAIPALLSVSRIEQRGPYKWDYFDTTPSVGKLMDKQDEETVKVCKKLGLANPMPCKDMLAEAYGVKGKNMYETVRQCDSYKGRMSPDSLKHRFITEDVPYGFVPIASLGEKVGVATPVTSTMINLASYINDEDYWKLGRTTEKMGIADLSVKQIINFVKKGCID